VTDKLVLYFILVLAIIAVSLWTIFLIQNTKLLEQSAEIQREHSEGAIDARKDLEHIMGNISEINQKLNE
jgi:peptidoglycan hydrolase CwlO-like protein